MTTDHWLRIVTIISTLIAPIIGAFVQSRIKQPTQTPEANQPQSRTHRSGGWFSRITSSGWFFAFGIAYNLFVLVLELRRSGPVDRGTILLIVVPIASIILLLDGWSFISMSRNRPKRQP